MKKIMVIAGCILVLLIGSATAVMWYAMAKAAMKMVKNNALYMSQQVQVHQFQLAFDYEGLQIGSHYLRPKIVMTGPHFTLTNASGTYYIRMPEVEFIGSFNQYHKFEILPADSVWIEKKNDPEKVYKVTPSEYPELFINSVSLEQETERLDQEYYWFSEYKLLFPKAITLEVQKGENEPETVVFDTRHHSFAQWERIHYRFYHHLNHLVQLAEKTGDGRKSLDRLL